MMKNPDSPAQAPDAVDLIRPYLEGELDFAEARVVEARMKADPAFAQQVELRRKLLDALGKAYAARKLSPGFEQTAQHKLSHPTTGPVMVVQTDELDEPKEAAAVSAAASLYERLGGAPWWFISISLHILVIALVSLITMAVGGIAENDNLIVVTSLERAPKVAPADEQKKSDQVRDILESKHDTPATDPNSTERSDIVVPPDILAKAELGDHFETVNPDRPDTHSAFGNPDAHMFHSESGNDEPPGGGGNGGNGLMDDLIGVGGATSPGSGGGWGGGNGTGTGVDNGSGHGSFGSRTGGGRKLMVMRHGGGQATESAVDKALEWLAKHQDADGHWDVKKHGGSASGDTAVTGLALLAFLGAGHSEKVGKYKENVQRGVKWLISVQNADGRIEKAGDKPGGYNHSIAALALAEAAGMGRIQATRDAAQKAVDYSTEIFQQGKGSEKLGWRYEPQQLGDTSVSGWFIMQIKSAKIAGLKVDTAAFQGADKFLDTVMTEAPKPGDPYSGHKYGYIHDGNGPNGIRTKNAHGNTAIAILGRQFLGYKREELQGGVEFFIKEGGVPRQQHPEFYYWYYGTLCAFQQGGDIWKNWNEGLKGALLPMQCKGGDNDGSWDPIGHSTEGAESAGGRVFTTAVGALCLEVYYRYLPLYR